MLKAESISGLFCSIFFFYLYCSFPFLPSHPAPSLLFLLFFPISIPNLNNVNPEGTHRIQKKRKHVSRACSLNFTLSLHRCIQCPVSTVGASYVLFCVLGPGSLNHKQTNGTETQTRMNTRWRPESNQPSRISNEVLREFLRETSLVSKLNERKK